MIIKGNKVVPSEGKLDSEKVKIGKNNKNPL